MNIIEKWKPAQVFYIESMLTICNSIAHSILQIQDCQGDKINHTTVLDALQNIVVQSTALSKYFWNIPNKYDKEKNRIFSERANYLRKVFKINDNNPLNNRKLRNVIEHFDENLDLFLQGIISGRIFPNYVGRKPPQDELPITYFFRAYFTDTDEFVVLNNSCLINPICDEVEKIYKILKQTEENGYCFVE